MNLNNINKLLLKDIFTLDFHRKDISFKEGEILKGEVLKKLENYFLINIEKRGLVKAFSNVSLTTNKVWLKVLSTKPEVILKLLEQDKNYKNIFQLIDNVNIKEIFDEFPESAKKVFLFSNDLKNSNQLLKKIKFLPENLGLTFEKELANSTINKNSLKYKILNNENLHGFQKKFLHILNSFQQLENNYQFFIPLFFLENSLEKGFVGFKRKKNNVKEDDNFSIVLYLELTGNRKLQVNIIVVKKNLSIGFLSNNEKFLQLLQKDVNILKKALEDKNFVVISTNFKYLNSKEFEGVLEEILNEENNFNIIDIKT